MMTSDDRMYTLVIDDMTVGNKARTNSEHRHTLSVPVCMWVHAQTRLCCPKEYDKFLILFVELTGNEI